jgi:iron complex transport system ATP-binding protein
LASFPPLDSQAPLLRIQDATVRKGRGRGRVILDRLNLAIPAGENCVILGPNGSGKSSLIRLISLDYRPLATAGCSPAVQVFGRDRWDVLDMRRLLGIVTPDVERSFLEEGAPAHLEGLNAVISGFFASPGVQPHQRVTPAMRERACRALETMEALDLAEKLLEEMSTGEARRVLISRALVSDPPALLLDEPTAGLDVVAMHRFLGTLRSIARSGRTIVLVTHHIHEIIPEITRVVLLRNGRIVGDGPKSDVLSTESLSAAFGAPMLVNLNGTGYYSVSVDSHAGAEQVSFPPASHARVSQ